MFKKLTDWYWLKKSLRQQELSDKKYLIELANVLDKAEYDNIGCMKMTRELADQASYRLRRIGHRMVIK